jgi:hypothetical protein
MKVEEQRQRWSTLPRIPISRSLSVLALPLVSSTRRTHGPLAAASRVASTSLTSRRTGNAQLDPRRGHHELSVGVMPMGEGGSGVDEGDEGVVPVVKDDGEGSEGVVLMGEGGSGAVPVGVDENIPLLYANVDI